MSNDSSSVHTSSSDTSSNSSAKIGWLNPTLLSLSVLVVVAARATASQFDFAVANIVTLIGGIVFYATALSLWLRLGRSSPSTKAMVTLAPLALILVGLFFYQPIGVDSELFPRFRYRWASSPPATTNADIRTEKLEPETARDPSTNLSEYSGFLGNDRTATIVSTALQDPATWTNSTPKLLWKSKIGAGWSAFSVARGIAVTLEQNGDDEELRAYSLLSGAPLWTLQWPAKHFTSLGGLGPRSTPTIADGIVYAQGANGYLLAAKLESGEKVWEKNLLELVGVDIAEAVQEVAWGRSSSPLVYEGRVIVPLGGAGSKIVSLICFDSKTGEEQWRVGTEQVSYASPTLMTLQGVPQIVVVNNSSVSAHRLQDGAELWRTEWSGASNGAANVSQPVGIDDQRVLLSKAYGTGAKMIKLSQEKEGSWNVETLWQNSSVLKTKFTNVVVRQGYAYGLSDGILECVDLANGKRMWKSKRYRHGQIMLIGEHILIIAEDGSVALGVADPKEFKELFRFQAIEGMTWNNPALAGDLLLVRNGEQAACYRLPIQKNSESIDSSLSP